MRAQANGSSNHPGGVPWCPPSECQAVSFWRQTRGVSGVLIMAWMEGVGAPLPGVSFAKFASREQQMKRVIGCSAVLLCLLLMLEVLAGGCHGTQAPLLWLRPKLTHNTRCQRGWQHKMQPTDGKITMSWWGCWCNGPHALLGIYLQSFK